jgi:hypothetical protein
MRSICPGLSSSRRARSIACCALLVLSGCNGSTVPLGKMVPVQGKVYFNGTPLAQGIVTFVPTEEQAKGPRPEGVIAAGGAYALSTRGKEGAPVGTYRAVITPGPDDKDLAGAIDPRYCHPDQSPLVIEVAENKPDGAYDLNVKARGQP